MSVTTCFIKVSSFKEENMKRFATYASVLSMALAFHASTTLAATAKAPAIQDMSQEELIRTARSAAPPHISGNATVMAPGTDGKLTVIREGSNEFTCIPDLSGQEVADPICGDRAATQWILSMLNNEPTPANTVPGFAYMAKGGWHFEKDGNIVMDPATPGATRVKDPPHWMVFWPVDSSVTGLPIEPGKFGTYVMFPDSPYSHLMIHQDPMKLPRG